MILCSYLAQTQSSGKRRHLVQIQGRLFNPVNVNRTTAQLCIVTMTTGHLTGTVHNGMFWSDRNELELSAADRWTGWLGDMCEMQDTREERQKINVWRREKGKIRIRGCLQWL